MDRDGSLWLGTAGAGVVRRDATGWRSFTTADGLVSNGVSDLYQSVDGAIWATGVGGYSVRRGGRWVADSNVGGMRPRLIFGVPAEPDGGALWFAANGGAARFDGLAWRTFTTADGLPHQVVHQVHRDRSGVLWFACRRGLARLDDGGWTVLHPDLNFRSIVEDDGRLWFGTSAHGVLRYEDGAWRTELPGLGVHPLLLDRRGTLWGKTDGRGVWRRAEGAWTQLTVRDGLVSDTVHAIAEAPDGAIWFGTAGGVTRLVQEP